MIYVATSLVILNEEADENNSTFKVDDNRLEAFLTIIRNLKSGILNLIWCLDL